MYSPKRYRVVSELARQVQHCQAMFLARVARNRQCKRWGRGWEPGGLEAADSTDSTTWADNVGRCCVSRRGFEKEKVEGGGR